MNICNEKKMCKKMLNQSLIKNVENTFIFTCKFYVLYKNNCFYFNYFHSRKIILLSEIFVRLLLIYFMRFTNES